MSMSDRNGCNLWAILIIILGVSSVLFVGGFSSYNLAPTTSPTLTSTPVVASDLVVSTVIPQPTDAAYFIVENNQITYRYTSTLGDPCYYVISGRVLDLEGEPFTNFIVNIKMLGEFALGAHGYAWAGEGGSADAGPSGWASLLPSGPANYEIWLTDGSRMGGSNGIELSPHIFVESRDCEHNEAVINFVQVVPFP